MRHIIPVVAIVALFLTPTFHNVESKEKASIGEEVKPDKSKTKDVVGFCHYH